MTWHHDKQHYQTARDRTLNSCFLFVLLLGMLSPLSAFAAESPCHEHIDGFEGLTEVGGYAHPTDIKIYDLPGDTISFGDVQSDLIVNLFYRDKYYGKIASFNGVDSYNQTIRLFQKQYGQPVTSPGHDIIWLTDDDVIYVRRFSYHLFEVGIFCRGLYEDLMEKKITFVW